MRNEPAFPRPIGTNGINNFEEREVSDAQEGMTLRDYFASKALPAVIDAYMKCNGHVIGTDHIVSNCPVIAYKVADAMLAERAK